MRDDEKLSRDNLRRGTNWATWLLVAGGVVLLLIFLLGTPGFFNPTNDSRQDGAERQTGEVMDNPEEFMGSRVDLKGDINRVVNDRAFVIDGPGILGDQLLVVSRMPLTQVGVDGDLSALEDSEVSVTGIVRQMDLAQLQQELGINMDQELFRNWEGRPIVVADAVNTNR